MTTPLLRYEFKLLQVKRTARSRKSGFRVYRRAILNCSVVNRGLWRDEGIFDTRGAALEFIEKRRDDLHARAGRAS